MKPLKLHSKSFIKVIQISEKKTSDWIYHTHFPPQTAVLEY